jgi:hypothetical protein
MSGFNLFYFNLEEEIPRDVAITFEDNLKTGLIGYKNILKCLRYLRNEENDKETKEYLKRIQVKYNIDYTGLDKNKLEEREKDLIKHYLEKYNKLLKIKRINNNLLIILDDTLNKEMKKLEQLEDIINI